jgi:N utilization substance protein B
MSGVKATHHRSRARSWTLQLLYAWDTTGEGDPLSNAAKAMQGRRMSDRYRPYVQSLLTLVSEHLEQIDATLLRNMPNWRLERLAVVDRNILRIGSAELLFAADVPAKVAIHEAIRLAERYGSAESPGFINGVLDAVYRELEGQASAPEAQPLDAPG